MDHPVLMGIVNINQDSFYQRGDLDTAMELTKKHLEEGAEIIDIGVCSTRPGAEVISEEQEIKRLMPCLETIRKAFPDCILSVDTFRGKVVQEAYRSIGSFIVNDVSGGKWDLSIREQAAVHKLPYILTHSQGLPKNMQSECLDTNVLDHVLRYFQTQITDLRKMGIADVWIDPGFGFAKTLEQNYEILSNLRIFEVLSCPVLVGLSRKSMIYKALNSTPEESLLGTCVAHNIALSEGAQVLRVHDVGAARDTIRISQLSQQHKHEQ